MVVSLEPCPSCFRHVRADNTVCPFCSTTFPEEFHRRLAPVAPPRAKRIENFNFRALGYVSIAASVVAGLTLSDCEASTGISFYGGSPGGDIIVSPPRDLVLPPGVKIGGPCNGAVYFDDGGGYVFCDDGVWEYTDIDPTTLGLSDAGYEEIYPDGGHEESSSIGSSLDSAQASGTTVSSSSSSASTLDAGSDGASDAGADASVDAVSDADAPD